MKIVKFVQLSLLGTRVGCGERGDADYALLNILLAYLLEEMSGSVVDRIRRLSLIHCPRIRNASLGKPSELYFLPDPLLPEIA